MISKIAERLFQDQLVSDACAYLEARRYRTQTHELRTGCFVVEGHRQEMGVSEIHLLMVITDREQKAQKDHIKHLLSLGKKYNADDLSIVCDAPATAAAQKAVAKAPVTVLNTFDLDSMPAGGSQQRDKMAGGRNQRGSGRRPTTRTASPREKLKQGALYGAIVWIAGYIVSWLLFAMDSALSEEVFGDEEINTWKAVGLTFYNSHLVDSIVTVSGGGEQVSGSINFISDSELTIGGETMAFPSASHPEFVFYFVPALALLAGGFLAAESLHGSSMKDASIRGSSTIVGYLPLTFLGLFLFQSTDRSGLSGEVTMTVSPDAVPALLLMGVVWPAVCSALGGIISYKFGSQTTAGTGGGANPLLTRRMVLGGTTLAAVGGTAYYLATNEISDGSLGDSLDSGPETIENPEGEYVDFLHHNISGGGFGGPTISVQGEVENISGGNLMQVRLTVVFFAQQGTDSVEVHETRREGLAAGEVWNFDVELPNDGRIDIVDGYDISARVTTE